MNARDRALALQRFRDRTNTELVELRQIYEKNLVVHLECNKLDCAAEARRQIQTISREIVRRTQNASVKQ